MSKLADWVQDELVGEHSRLAQRREEINPIPEDAADNEIWLTRREKKMLTDAFENKEDCGQRWSAVAAHLRSTEVSPQFLEIVAGLIEHGGFKNSTKLGQEFLRRARIYELYQSVHNILKRDYPKANDSAFFTKWLTVVLSGNAENGTPDSTLHRQRYEEVSTLIKGYNKRIKDGNELYEIVYSVWHDHAC